jgi:hypothetical protein
MSVSPWPAAELVLVLPVGALLAHPALCDAAGGRCAVPRPIAGAAAGAGRGLHSSTSLLNLCRF